MSRRFFIHPGHYDERRSITHSRERGNFRRGRLVAFVPVCLAYLLLPACFVLKAWNRLGGELP
jgi:hypothetical protein